MQGVYVSSSNVALAVGRNGTILTNVSTTIVKETAQETVDFVVYPNPVINELTFEFENTQKRKITIYNTNGQLVLSLDSKEKAKTIDLENYTNGVYYYLVKSAGGETIGTGEFVKP
jgi:hypothetical protein